MKIGILAAMPEEIEAIVGAIDQRHTTNVGLRTYHFGSLHGVLRGDLVIGTELIQHDLDASPLFARHEVPLVGVQRFATDSKMNAGLLAAAREIAGGRGHSVHSGLIATGDQFFSSRESVERLRGMIPDTLCVEMEGAGGRERVSREVLSVLA